MTTTQEENSHECPNCGSCMDEWHVSMKGKLGFSCRVSISQSNATTPQEAIDIARMMFPELKSEGLEQ